MNSWFFKKDRMRMTKQFITQRLQDFFFFFKDVLIDPPLNKKVCFFTLCFIYIQIFPTCWSAVSHDCQVKLAQTVTKPSLKGGRRFIIRGAPGEPFSTLRNTSVLIKFSRAAYHRQFSPRSKQHAPPPLIQNFFFFFLMVHNAAERRENGVQRSAVCVWVAESLRYLQFVQPPEEEGRVRHQSSPVWLSSMRKTEVCWCCCSRRSRLPVRA